MGVEGPRVRLILNKEWGWGCLLTWECGVELVVTCKQRVGVGLLVNLGVDTLVPSP